MPSTRVFNSLDYLAPSDDEPIRNVVTSSADSTVVAWYVKPGQSIKPHRHPEGQDTWTVLSGEGDYVLDEQLNTTRVKAGDIVVAHANEVHGLHNSGASPFIFISVVAPSEAGYLLLTT